MNNTGIVYTYVVDHGHRPPRVKLDTPILGGRPITLAHGDLVQRLHECENFIKELLELAATDGEMAIRIIDFMGPDG